MAHTTVRSDVTLWHMSPTEAMKSAVDELIEQTGISKQDAIVLVKNALIYNCVIEEIVGQAKWLMGLEEL